jgi:uncharacterized LabA/DUF88 family protein
MADRAALFIDGNNWYHSLKGSGVHRLRELDYGLISKKLAGPRNWIATRYYIGALKHYHRGEKEQRRFLASIQNDDSRIQVRLGRIEDQPKRNRLAVELREFLGRNPGLPESVQQELEEMASRNALVSLLKEKAADVLLAVDMCHMAVQDQYDAAYILSADGDFTPAVELVRETGKKIYAVSATDCAALRNSADAYISVDRAWFDDCYRPSKH